MELFNGLFSRSSTSSQNNEKDIILIKLNAINVWIDKIKALAINLQKQLNTSKIIPKNIRTYQNNDLDKSDAIKQIGVFQSQIDALNNKFSLYEGIIDKIVESANNPTEANIDIDTNDFDLRRTSFSQQGPGQGPPEQEGQARGRAGSLENYPRDGPRGGYYYPSSSSKRNRKSLKNRKKYKGKGKSRSQGRSRGGMSRRRGMTRGRGRSRGRGRH